MSPISSMCHQTGLVAPKGDTQGIDAPGPNGDTLPWEREVPTPAQTPQVPLPAPQPRHRQQHRVPQLSSMRKRNKFPFPPQPKLPPEPLASCDDTARSSNILTCRQARHGPASPLINSTTIITVIADGSQWRRDQYLLLYDEFLHLRQPARKGNGSGRHRQHPPLPNLAGDSSSSLIGFFRSFCPGVIMEPGERDHLPRFPLCKRAVST